MKTISLKFASMAEAHSMLYIQRDGEHGPWLEPKYVISDDEQRGLAVERCKKILDETNTEIDDLQRPSNGAYVADISADETPEELKPFEIFPQEQYRKHRFAL